MDRTSFSLNQKIDGEYWLSFHTDTGNGSGFDWTMSDTAIGGTAQVPKMDTSFSCDPQWNAPPANSSDQNPIFGIATSYACTVSLADSLMRMSSKQISFQTGQGRLLVKSSNLDTSLRSGKSINGFVFDNQSRESLAIKDLTFDVSFRALNVSSPIVLRFVNPDNESSFLDFQVQNLPIDPAKPDVRTAAGMKVSLPFAMSPNAQRLLRVEVLGIQQLLTIGINPEFSVVLRQINMDNTAIKTVFFSPAILWSCIPYDPYRSSNLPNEQNCK